LRSRFQTTSPERQRRAPSAARRWRSGLVVWKRRRPTMSIRTLPMVPQLPPCDHVPEPYDGPPTDEGLALRRQYFTPGLSPYYPAPLLIVEGHMQYLWDERGTRYLDAFAGIVTVSVGHCHPYVVEKVRAQVGKLQHTTTIYLHPTIGEFGRRLAEHMPQ